MFFEKLQSLDIWLNLISYPFYYSANRCRLYFYRFYKMKLLCRYFSGKSFDMKIQEIWKFNLLQKDGLTFFVCLFVYFFLFRLLKILFIISLRSKIFLTWKTQPEAINGLNIKNNIFKIFKVLHNTQMSRWDAIISRFVIANQSIFFSTKWGRIIIAWDRFITNRDGYYK